METIGGVEILAFGDGAELEAWLTDHHTLQSGIWLKIGKKNCRQVALSYLDAVEVALCFGWIDGQAKSYDADHYLQKFTPRRPRGVWSKVNVGRIETLIEAGRMREPGLVEVRAAQADGRWDAAYESQKNATVPPDLTAALEGRERARQAFERLDKSARYRVLLRLMTARTPEVRAARLARALATLESDTPEG
ncbi:YdeI/OmpD-associated family protein [Streptomyces sp. PSRA5]|uniref:YdeI/OmpD-associated family protein n=1 Tax=Streptomyces panacea TaxID=3035064 RepID=UPI00339C2244